MVLPQHRTLDRASGLVWNPNFLSFLRNGCFLPLYPAVKLRD
jgi:hypothetical protein